MEKFQQDYLQKNDPSKNGSFLGKFNLIRSGEDSADIATAADTPDNEISSQRGKTGLMSMFKSAPIEKPKPTTFGGKMIAMLPEECNKTKALMFFGVASLFLLLAFVNILSIIISPAKFTCSFTIAVILGMIGLSLWNGPQAYVNKCFEKQYLIRTCTLIGSMFGAFWFSVIGNSYLMSIIFCIIEFNAVLLFFCNTFPIGRSAQNSVQGLQNQAAMAAVRSSFSGMLGK